MLNQQGQQKLVNILLYNTLYIFFQCSNIKIIPVSFSHIILQTGEDTNTQELLKQVRFKEVNVIVIDKPEIDPEPGNSKIKVALGQKSVGSGGSVSVIIGGLLSGLRERICFKLPV